MMSSSGSGPSKCKSMKRSSYRETEIGNLEEVRYKITEWLPMPDIICAKKAKSFHEALR
jgi:hypothetical protein